MKIYKPFEYLFCSLQELYNRKQVIPGVRLGLSGFIACLQSSNIIFLAILYSKIFQSPFKFNLFILVFAFFCIINLSYFNKQRVESVLLDYDKLERETKIINGIYSGIYIVASFVLLFVGLNLFK